MYMLCSACHVGILLTPQPGGNFCCYDDALFAGGYAYITYDTVKSVERAVNACRTRNGRKKLHVTSRDGFKTVVRKYSDSMFTNSRTTADFRISQTFHFCNSCVRFQMEVIPWLLKNNYYSKGDAPTTNVEIDRTVFVGGIPGDFTAEDLAHAFQNEFGGCVEMVNHHTDRSFYPTGMLLQDLYTTFYSQCTLQPLQNITNYNCIITDTFLLFMFYNF